MLVVVVVGGMSSTAITALNSQMNLSRYCQTSEYDVIVSVGDGVSTGVTVGSQLTSSQLYRQSDN